MARVLLGVWLLSALLGAVPVSAQTITSEPRIVVVFYVKEATNSPYQGRLEMEIQEYGDLRPSELETRQLEQFEAWKVATKAAQDAPRVGSVDERVIQVKSLRAQANEIAADPAVALKLLENP